MKTILVKAGPVQTEQTAEVVNVPGWRALYGHFKGFIEIVNPRRLPQPYCIVVDESGLLHGLPANAFASWLYQTDIHGSPIVGDAFLMKQQMGPDGYELAGLSDGEINAISVKYGLRVKN